jgi:hypothetical protein
MVFDREQFAPKMVIIHYTGVKVDSVAGRSGCALADRDSMIRFQDKMWGEPENQDWEGVFHSLTPDEVARIPMNDVRMFVLTLDDNTQELQVDMDAISLSQRFPHCERVRYRRVVDPSVAIPFLMGGNLRLGANSPVRSLGSNTLRHIMQFTILH